MYKRQSHKHGEDREWEAVAMRITLLGHASLVVEMDGAACLMDSVFYDRFEEGAVVSCPRRTVSLAVSYTHLDVYKRQRW